MASPHALCHEVSKNIVQADPIYARLSYKNPKMYFFNNTWHYNNAMLKQACTNLFATHTILEAFTLIDTGQLLEFRHSRRS